MYETNEVNKESVDTAPKKVVTKEEKPKKRFKWKKFLGYFILGIFVLGIGYIGYRFYTFTPYRVIVSNVTSRSATISWVTDSAQPGMVVFKEEKTLLPIWVSKYGLENGFDDRDYTTAELLAAEQTQENIAESDGITAEDIETEIVVTSLGKYWSHHVTVRNLDPETEYEFLVGDGLVFEKANTVDTEVSKLTTLKEQESIDTPMPAYGIVRYYYEEDSEEPLFLRANDAVVYTYLREEVSEIESKNLSSTMNDEGGWYLDLTSANTSEGENFFDALGSAETTDVNLYFTVEGVGFGRWTIIKNLEDIAPSDSFDLVDPEDEDDSDLDFQGYSFGTEEDSLVSSLVAKIIAKEDPELLTGEEAYQEFLEENKTTWQAPGTTAYGGSSREGIGTCRGDICNPGNQCGWVNDLNCRCVCEGGETIDIAPGTTCRCSSEGKASATGEEQAALSEIKAGYCANDGENSSKSCWSATNGCWYSAGHVAQNGLTCEPSGRWGDPKHGIDDYPIDVVPNDKTGVCCYINHRYEWKTGVSSCSDGSIMGQYPDKTSCDNRNAQVLEALKDNDLVTCYIAIGEVKEGVYKKTMTTTKPQQEFMVLTVSKPKSECTGTVEKTLMTDPDIQKTINTEFENVKDGVGCIYSTSISMNYLGILNGDFVISNDNGIFKCEKGSWKEVNSYDGEFEEGKDCAGFNDITIINGKQYICQMFKWVEGNSSTVAATIGLVYKDIVAGNDVKCDAGDFGFCNCMYERTSLLEECPLGKWVEGQNNTCNRLIKNDEPCSRNMDNLVDQIKFNFDTFASIDSSYYIWTTNDILGKLEAGTYLFEVGGDKFIVSMNEANVGKPIYLDINNNGIVDDGDINVSEDFETIKVKTIEKQFGYTLKEGFNFVSFPFVFTNDEIKTASDLLTYLNERYNDAFYSISKYDSGKWKMVGSNGGTYNQNDFQIIPGEGYVLKTKTDIYVRLYGNEVTYESSTDSAPIRFTPGWNLLGLYGSNVKSYTAESILTDITNYQNTDFTAVNVSRWVENRALYEALQRDEDSTVYGLDFPIELKKGYFIKVTKGEGNWEPGID